MAKYLLRTLVFTCLASASSINLAWADASTAVSNSPTQPSSNQITLDYPKTVTQITSSNKAEAVTNVANSNKEKLSSETTTTTKATATATLQTNQEQENKDIKDSKDNIDSNLAQQKARQEARDLAVQQTVPMMVTNQPLQLPSRVRTLEQVNGATYPLLYRLAYNGHNLGDATGTKSEHKSESNNNTNASTSGTATAITAATPDTTSVPPSPTSVTSVTKSKFSDRFFRELLFLKLHPTLTVADLHYFRPSFLRRLAINQEALAKLQPLDYYAEIAGTAISTIYSYSYRDRDISQPQLVEQSFKTFLQQQNLTDLAIDKATYQQFVQQVIPQHAQYSKGFFPLHGYAMNLEPLYASYKELANYLGTTYQSLAQFVQQQHQPLNLNTDRDYLYNQDYATTSQELQQRRYNYFLHWFITAKVHNNQSWDRLRVNFLKSMLYYANLINTTNSYTLFNDHLNSLATNHDPHTSIDFKQPEISSNNNNANTTDKKLQKNDAAIGVGIQYISGNIEIVEIDPDGVAAKSPNIQVGDVIVAISSDKFTWHKLDSLNIHQITDLIRGPEKSNIYLYLTSRDGKSKIVLLTRSYLYTTEDQDQDLTFKTFNDAQGNVFGVLKFDEFTLGIANQIAKTLNDNQNLAGLIIDLRHNIGGLVDETLMTATPFIGAYKNFMQTRRGHNPPANQATGVAKTIPLLGYRNLSATMPIIVLTSSKSASAAELLAGSLQDYQRAIIVGSQTFGKGISQTAGAELFFLDNNIPPVSYTFTDGHFTSVDGRSPQIDGVIPDIKLHDQELYAGERTSPHALPNITVPPTSYDKFTQYVTPEYLEQLKQELEQYTKATPSFVKFNEVYSALESFNHRKNDENKESLNFQYRYKLEMAQQIFFVDSYNSYAQSHDKPKVTSFYQLQHPTLQPYVADPNLDAVKHLIQIYSKLYYQDHPELQPKAQPSEQQKTQSRE